MKNILYIDANIYLKFYYSQEGKFIKLLPSIEELGDNIFMSQQIADEISRNKIDVFLKTFFDDYVSKFTINNVTLPSHLQGEALIAQEIKTWNQQKESIRKDVKEQLSVLKNIGDKLAEHINEDNDKVSKIILKISANAKVHSPEQIERARQRKERGNPPGKPNDPLGDQISWEQLLDNIETAENLWIITDDKDYLSVFDKKCYLNNYLLRELKVKNPNLSVFCFQTLADGLGSFNEIVANKITALPEEKELNQIADEERIMTADELIEYLNNNPHKPGPISDDILKMVLLAVARKYNFGEKPESQKSKL